MASRVVNPVYEKMQRAKNQQVRESAALAAADAFLRKFGGNAAAARRAIQANPNILAQFAASRGVKPNEISQRI